MLLREVASAPAAADRDTDHRYTRMIDAAIRFGDGDIIAFVREGCFGIHSKEHGTLFTEPLGIAGAKIECLASMTELAKGELEPDIESLNDDFEWREWSE